MTRPPRWLVTWPRAICANGLATAWPRLWLMMSRRQSSHSWTSWKSCQLSILKSKCSARWISQSSRLRWSLIRQAETLWSCSKSTGCRSVVTTPILRAAGLTRWQSWILRRSFKRRADQSFCLAGVSRKVIQSLTFSRVQTSRRSYMKAVIFSLRRSPRLPPLTARLRRCGMISLWSISFWRWKMGPRWREISMSFMRVGSRHTWWKATRRHWSLCPHSLGSRSGWPGSIKLPKGWT